jgi:hypothetical protein
MLKGSYKLSPQIISFPVCLHGTRAFATFIKILWQILRFSSLRRYKHSDLLEKQNAEGPRELLIISGLFFLILINKLVGVDEDIS